MEELGVVLERMHGARHRWHTVTAVCHDWSDHERMWRARGRPGALHGVPPGAAPASLGVIEEEIRVWIVGADRAREEVTKSPHRAGAITVINGERWWMRPAADAEPSQGRLADVGVTIYDVGFFLDPSTLLPYLDFDEVTNDHIEGAPTWRIEAAVRQPLSQAAPPQALVAGDGDHYRLWIDKTRGFALRVEALFEGKPSLVRSIQSLVVDSSLPPELFNF